MATPNLPMDIITSILSRLPPKPLLRFKCVSKPWRSLIQDPNFINMHLKRANNLNIMLRGCYLYSLDCNSLENDKAKAVDLDYPYKTKNGGVQILGSCDGLVCVTTEQNVFCIWNPSTQEFKKLPTTRKELSLDAFRCETVLFGFGYDHTIRDYKVVRVVKYFTGGNDLYFEANVYTLGTNSWKRAQDAPCNLVYKRVYGVLVNGACHWAANRLPVTNLANVIASFDLVGRVFKEVPQPCYKDDHFHMNVGVLGGCLCVMANYNMVRLDLWVMKEYGVQDSWTTLFSITQQSVLGPYEFFKPLCYTNDAGMILEKEGKDIVLYDPISKNVTTLEISGIPDWRESETYVGSLVSLHSGTYVGQEHAKGNKKQNRKKGGKKR